MNDIICNDKIYQLSIKLSHAATLFKTLVPMSIVLWKRQTLNKGA